MSKEKYYINIVYKFFNSSFNLLRISKNRIRHIYNNIVKYFNTIKHSEKIHS